MTKVARADQDQTTPAPASAHKDEVVSLRPAESRKAEDAPARTEPPVAAPQKPKGSKKRILLPIIGLAALAGIGYFGYNYWTVGRFMVSTDDAYIQADVTTLVAKASGYVAKIPVKDNSRVKAGDVLAQIDPIDYQLAVQSAQNKIDAEQATIDRIAAQIPASQAAVQQAQAQVTSAQATQVRTQADFERAQALAARDFGSKQALDAARAARDSAVAGVASAQAALAQAQANIDVTRAQQKEASAALAELRTALESARRDLSFTEIRAPADGTVGNRAVDVGSYVTTGSRVMALVPTSTLYVSANFKETQLASLVPGQEVELSIDAVRKVTVKGHVESIAPASGSVFSLLPVENATGNFTKIVQRVPVRIAVSAADAEKYHLRPGLSVVADVDTRTTPAGADRPGE
ncbi:membrane fusion protein, multidrug efflux system [Faunimonas pinastri]|uniref:Membrane fusion protein, multidrug efflux system n=1 Tax=Faunimonas pinastri TaxID=1855383 RepID=A0A1H9A502_9HYPH|nr:HlyD family secretion protein [Faunimonas pinastri]SEP71068.1 membrane fusion protein, multidrug efflux system [Faunimonas pinastri]